ncbi:MAG: N-acetyl-gamma-glutamyl-phosphate reductase [Kiritimatiellaeota bacterium]|nr:N-acetyl-gamma-glutamyl-phosphate reductase [Kiritimatiellota bacterium]
MTTVKVVGASGYGGVGIIELLLRHPEARIKTLVAQESVGAPVSELYPHLAGFCDMQIHAPDAPDALEPVDVVFMSTPDGVGMKAARAELERGAQVIDFSGDFRFNTEAEYAEYANAIGKNPVHADPSLLPLSVYGAAELHRAEINPSLKIAGNPGCFAISCILGLAPAAASGIVRPDSLICDCKSGVSGAGKKLAAAHHFPNRYETMNAYRLAGHQHITEIERELSRLAGAKALVTFTAQVVPMCRGIMSCLYGDLMRDADEQSVIALYKEFYKDSPFVRVLPSASPAGGTAFVRGTNYANLVVSVDSRTRRLRIVSYIDNLVKGQAGSALQCMNLLRGYPETMGLTQPGCYP